MYNYAVDVLIKDGKRVRRLQIVGLCCEAFLRLAFHDRKGLNALQWHSINGCVTLWGVTVNARRYAQISVAVPREDAELALRVALAIADGLVALRFTILDAIVPQQDADGNRVPSHDLVAERRGCHGKASVEVKLATVKKTHFRERLRERLRKESLQTWKAATSKAGHAWGERVVVLVEFGPQSADQWVAIRIETLRIEHGTWAALTGWTSGVRDATRHVPSQPATRPAVPRPQPAAARPPRNQKRSFESISRDKKFEWEDVRGQSMGSVNQLLDLTDTPAAKKARPTLGERLPTWKKKFAWPPKAYDRSLSKGSSTGGGKLKWMATEQALQDIHSLM